MILKKVLKSQSIRMPSSKDKKALLKQMILYCAKGETAIDSPDTLLRILSLFDSYRFVQAIHKDTFQQLDSIHNTVIKDLDPRLLAERRLHLKDMTRSLTKKIFRTSKCQFYYAGKNIRTRGVPGESIYIILQGKVKISTRILTEGYHFTDEDGSDMIVLEETYLLVIRQPQMKSV